MIRSMQKPKTNTQPFKPGQPCLDRTYMEGITKVAYMATSATVSCSEGLSILDWKVFRCWKFFGCKFGK
jgi:hypothetical protein